MAIFQPTNIIPSSFTQGTIDVNDNMEISWQVNGNSKLEAFQIDFYLNDYASTYVTTTGKLTDNIPQDSNGNIIGFYGTDRFGRPQFFTWNLNGQTWADWSMLKPTPFTNGNNYKFKITQFFSAEGDDIYSASPTGSLSGKKTLSLRIDSNIVNKYVVFDFGNQTYASATVYFNWTKQKGWIVSSNRVIPIPTLVFDTETGGGLGEGQLVPINDRDDFVIQTSFSTFITRLTPTLTIYSSSSDRYGDEITFPNMSGDFNASIGYFVAKYYQAQSDPIRWIRWQVATATYNSETEKWISGDILADTGDIYTPTLNFEFNGFFNGQRYAIRCLGESESGQSTQLQGANADGWVYFNIEYSQNIYTGNFSAQCLHKENATLLEWEAVNVITGNYTKPEGSEETYTLQYGTVVLPANSSITWNKVGVGDTEEDMYFTAPWTAVWKGDCIPTQTGIVSNYIGNVDRNGSAFTAGVSAMAFNPNGNLLVVGGNGGFAYLFRASGQNIEFVSEIKKNGANLYNPTDFIRFSPNGNTLLIGSRNYGIQIFSVSGENLTYINDLKYNNSTIRCSDAVFNSDGDRLIVLKIGLGSASDEILLYDVSQTTFSYSGLIYSINATTQLSQGHLLINHANTMLVVYGYANTSAKMSVIYFNIDGDNFTYAGGIKDNQGSYIFGTAIGASFSPNDSLLAICGRINGVFNLYSIENGIISFKQVITKNGTPFNSVDGTIDCAFSSNGKALAFSGDTISGKSVMFSVNDNEVQYSADIGNFCGYIEFSPSSDILLTASPDGITVSEYSIEYVSTSGLSGVFFSLNNEYITASSDGENVSIAVGTAIYPFPIPNNSQSLTLFVMHTSIRANFYNGSRLIEQNSAVLSVGLPNLTSVQISGGSSGATVSSVSIFNTPNSEVANNVLNNYAINPDFEPVWNDNSYQLYMTANFNGNIQGGTGNAEGNGFQVYRREVGGNILTPIANLSALQTSMKDYGIRSRKVYEYLLGVYDSNNAFMGLVTAENTIATCFKNYSLLVCDYDEVKDEYHVRKQYLFALNLSAGGVGNNNSPTLNANFTQYPTRMPSTQNYASGTLQGLIGAIYTVPALVEQIGQYKHTAKPSTLDYFDSVDLEKELYDLSTAPYQLFLRDMKGRLRMIATSGAISMTTNIKQKQQSISISFPWVEVGDASDVTIIQTPKDEGWNNDNQVLDVQLDVDVATGELSATYPFPYNGTKFYLTGVNKENLTAKTPLGVTPAQFNLSDTATETTDGEVTATVTVNSEVNE